MAKIIKITPECIEEIRKDFEAALESAKLSDGKINFSKSFEVLKRGATVYFTEIAWMKMQALIREFDKEVAWHGLAYRGDDPEKDEYFIRDILVYPQEVTGATVTTDQQKYQEWLMNHDDDVFNNIRMQGHSHVNMGTSPSGVDTSLYERILEQLDDTMFYIFLIYNKRGEKTYKIYDLAKNVLFETSDVTVKILEEDTGIEKFLREAKEMVKEKSYAYGGYGGYYSGGYSGYAGSSANNTCSKVTTYKAEEKKEEPKPAAKTEAKEEKKDTAVKTEKTDKPDKTGRRKGKRKKSKGFKQYSIGSMYSYDYDEYDDDDPYGAFGYRSGAHVW